WPGTEQPQPRRRTLCRADAAVEHVEGDLPFTLRCEIAGGSAAAHPIAMGQVGIHGFGGQLQGLLALVANQDVVAFLVVPAVVMQDMPASGKGNQQGGSDGDLHGGPRVWGTGDRPPTGGATGARMLTPLPAGAAGRGQGRLPPLPLDELLQLGKEGSKARLHRRLVRAQ